MGSSNSSGSWYAYNHGRTLGTSGSERGNIIRDETYDGGVRITLERDTPTAAYAITCGIGGWLVHTRFLSYEVEAQQAFEDMKAELARIYNLIPYKDDPEAERIFPQISCELHEFITRFP